MPVLRPWRNLLPAAMLVLVVALFARHSYPLPPDTGLLLWLSRLDPLLLAGFLRWEGSFPPWGWLPLAMLVLALAAGRVFCGWLCPLGGLLNLLHGLRRSGRRPAWIGRLHPYRWWWLLALAITMVAGSGWTLYLTPFSLLTSELSRLWQDRCPGCSRRWSQPVCSSSPASGACTCAPRGCSWRCCRAGGGGR